jgi:hypothetical protein
MVVIFVYAVNTIYNHVLSNTVFTIAFEWRYQLPNLIMTYGVYLTDLLTCLWNCPTFMLIMHHSLWYLNKFCVISIIKAYKHWLDSMRFGVCSWKLSNVGWSLDGWPKIYHLELLRALEGTLSRWSRLQWQLIAPVNSQWARVVGYGPLSLCLIHRACALAVGTLIGWWWWWWWWWFNGVNSELCNRRNCHFSRTSEK